MKQRVLLIVLVCLNAMFLHAQNAVLSGTVLDPAGRPLAGANVVVTSDAGSEVVAVCEHDAPVARCLNLLSAGFTMT